MSQHLISIPNKEDDNPEEEIKENDFESPIKEVIDLENIEGEVPFEEY